MERDWDHFHRFRHCPLSYILLLKKSFAQSEECWKLKDAAKITARKYSPRTL